MAIIKPWAFGAAALLALNLSGVGKADTLAAQPSFSRTVVGFVPSKAYAGGTLTVIGPNGFAASASSKGGLPSLNLVQFGAVPDGLYAYQLDAATAQLDTSAPVQNNGRARKDNVRPRRADTLSGTFLVKGGSIVTPVAALASQGGNDRDH